VRLIISCYFVFITDAAFPVFPGKTTGKQAGMITRNYYNIYILCYNFIYNYTLMDIIKIV